ncbi:uncharacterized protein M421DRAFT_418481 [Didymella exigua CBS 183.55]|uniref:Uncharacterized protein n=1 Tax=Didymella exigua CBS 183.55 TaxID=1150837 RepID=A0A6A5RRD3_9PLEO|nr:uncharacterized protein M421DRAFT_418481 [Didymella exigua CBS 183.55]KAF1930991.1 hypothetical protein M421DRAFT_418481 [Didymella exigua CBS 183.55]
MTAAATTPLAGAVDLATSCVTVEAFKLSLWLASSRSVPVAVCRVIGPRGGRRLGWTEVRLQR